MVPVAGSAEPWCGSPDLRDNGIGTDARNLVEKGTENCPGTDGHADPDRRICAITPTWALLRLQDGVLTVF